MQQFLPADYEQKVADFHALLRSMMSGRNYKSVIAGDETGVRMEDTAATTMERRGTNQVPIRTSGKEKQLFTVWLWASMEREEDGWVCEPLLMGVLWRSHTQICKKGAPLLIFKGASAGKVERDVCNAAGPRASAITTENGWMNGETMLQWVRSNLKDMKDTLLIWDLFAAHRDARVLMFLKASAIDVIFVPGGCTGLCQVMDVVVNKSFKAHVRNAYISWRGDQVANDAPWASPKRPKQACC